MPKDYKVQKEAFVSNLHGGDVAEILAVTLVAPVCPRSMILLCRTQLTVKQTSVFLYSVLQSRLQFFSPYTLLPSLVDFLINNAALLFAVTLYSSQPVALNLLLTLPAILILLTTRPSRASKPAKPPATVAAAKQHDTFSSSITAALPFKPFITTYRGTMLTITFIAILAVDFPVFPRRFAKTENWGTSLMDLGVGSFVFSAGTVSARPVLRERLSRSTPSIVAKLRNALRHAAPLLVLGLIRLYSVKGLDYAEHVTEYGVHWNFFFTLALIPPFTALCDVLFRVIPSYTAIAVLLGLGYEIALESTDLTKFILTAPRTDLLSKNREGVFSFIGYLAIFLIGQGTGMYVLPGEPRRARAWQDPILRQLLLWTAVWSAAFVLLTDYRVGANLRVSRRMANLPYVLGVVAFNCLQLSLFYATELLVFPSGDGDGEAGAASRLLAALNQNGLALFLLANLGTGLVNLTMQTLYMGNVAAVGVLLVYMGAISGVALVLQRYRISIKL